MDVKLALIAAALCSSLFVPAASAQTGPSQSLAGEWRFRRDDQSVGIDRKWYQSELPASTKGPSVVRLPGSLAAQRVGDDPSVDTKWTGGIVDRSWFTAPGYEDFRQTGNVKIPFWLQPEKCYVGTAWYQRNVEVPKNWRGKQVVLTLERPHWETRVWVDGEAMGANDSLSTPHQYDLGQLSPGPHRLTVRVDNRMIVDVGENSHSVSDHTQGNWNGIVGAVELSNHDSIWLDRQRVLPRNDGTVRVQLTLRNAQDKPVAGTVAVAVRERPTGKIVGEGTAPFSLPPGIITASGRIDCGQTVQVVLVKVTPAPQWWCEFNPALYTVESRIEAAGIKSDTPVITTFGFREISTQGTQFLINGRKTFFRGTLECCIFPKTGHPPTDVDSWKRIIGVAKSYGLNLLRFHSWCPPEAAFVAADELGFYFHVECAAWPNQSTTLGDGKPIDQWLYAETDRILLWYGNHPSLVLMVHGNEPGGKNHPAYLKKWVEHYKRTDPRRLYSSGAGWPELPENEWHCIPGPRIQAWGGGLKSRINALPPETRTDYHQYIGKRLVPVVSHEIGQWCVYPNFDEIPKYTGHLKPKNFEIFRDLLRARGMEQLARQFLLASGKLQTLCYKEEIESALRTPGMGGFELLDLHDFPGQGTALVGVLDPFWDDKGYVTGAQYSRFCNSTVPLVRMSKRVYTADERLEADVEVAHFGVSPLLKASSSWKLVGDDGHVAASGNLPIKTIPVDNGIALGRISVSLQKVPVPARYRLVVGIPAARAENDWDLWVYPAKLPAQPMADVSVVDSWDARAFSTLEAGGKVLLLIPPKKVRNADKDKVVLGFSSIFWNTAWTRRQPPTTLGILCDPTHAALTGFPTDMHSNWQWWYLVTRAGAMILDDLPRDLQPVVQVVDDWFTARKLGLVFEANLGPGKLLVCSIDLQHGLDGNPVARQMRTSLLQYMASARFRPTVEVTRDAIGRLIAMEP